MSLLTLFAAVALALSATGIFGVMSYAVAQQSKEIGIRMALGARASDVLRSVVGRALALAGLGVIVGLVVSLAFGGVIRNQLFGVTIFDPTTLGVVVIVLMASAAIASLLPAMRAATDRSGQPSTKLPIRRTFDDSATDVRTTSLDVNRRHRIDGRGAAGRDSR